MTNFYKCKLPKRQGIYTTLQFTDKYYWKDLRMRFKAEDPASSYLFANWDIAVWLFRAPFYILHKHGEIVSVNATIFGKRPKGEWGRYLNSYIAYTPLEHRNKGYARMLALYIETLARQEGLLRGKSLVQSYYGFRYHLSLGHHFWGTNLRGELICDYPLTAGQPSGVPPTALEAGFKKRLTKTRLLEILQQPPFNKSSLELRKELGKREFLYR